MARFSLFDASPTRAQLTQVGENALRVTTVRLFVSILTRPWERVQPVARISGQR